SGIKMLGSPSGAPSSGSSMGALASETRVFVKFKKVTLEAIVQYSNPKDAGYRLCLSVTGEPERRRREPRLPVHQPATITSLCDGAIVFEGTLTDLSRSGLRAQIREPLMVGTIVCVETQTTIVVGEIRHCGERDGHYEIGVEITDILTDTILPDDKTGIIEDLRWKLATLIVGERLTIARKFLR
ncbi:MAG: PilZ domain-containing protein, partial [Bryobacteraceae bacterium]